MMVERSSSGRERRFAIVKHERSEKQLANRVFERHLAMKMSRVECKSGGRYVCQITCSMLACNFLTATLLYMKSI
jgi:hypothetical protein